MFLNWFADTKDPTWLKKLPANLPPAHRCQTSCNQKVDDISSQNTNLLLTTNQLEECTGADPIPWDPLPYCALKNSSLKAMGALGSFEHELPILLALPWNKRYTSLHHKLVSVDHFCFTSGDQTYIWCINKTAITKYRHQIKILKRWKLFRTSWYLF